MSSEVAVDVSIGAGGTDVGVINGIVECTGFTVPGLVWAGMVVARGTMATLLCIGDNSVSSMSSMIRRAPGSGMFLGLVAVLATSNVLVDGLLGEADGASGSEVECVPVSGLGGAAVAPSVATIASEWLWIPRVVMLASWMSISLASALS